MQTPPDLVRWSTDSVPVAQRFDYFAQALSSSLIPMGMSCEAPSELSIDIGAVALDGLTVIHQVGSPHCSFRRAADLRRDQAHTYHLIVNFATGWMVEHRARLYLRPGDAVFTDSRYGHEIDIRHRFNVLHLKLEEQWVRRWLPDPRVLVGRVILRDSGWGRALATYAAGLSPQWLVALPIATRLVADQLGALLSLIAAQVGGVPKASRATQALQERIKGCIALRCTEPLLDVATVAAELQQPEMAVHRALAACGESFNDALISARVEAALRMLESRAFANAVSLQEIARRAGFSGTASLARAVRLARGMSPAEIRKAAAGAGSIRIVGSD